MKTYKELINEMAKDIGKHSLSQFEHIKNYPTDEYERTKSHPIIGHIDSDITIHKDVDGDKTNYTVNDNRSHRSLFSSKIREYAPTSSLPLKHISQDAVDRVKDTSVLPSGYATNFIYGHFNSQKLPLKSSVSQYHKGRDMWSRLVDMAHHDGKHVYYFDEHGNHQKVQPETKSHYMDKYFGDHPDYESRNLVLSHTEL